MCWERGVYAIARFVGHSNVKTTLDIYTHLSSERASEAADTVLSMFDL
jgi:integrase